MKEGGVLDNVVFDSKCVRQHGVSQHCVVREPGSQCLASATLTGKVENS